MYHICDLALSIASLDGRFLKPASACLAVCRLAHERVLLLEEESHQHILRVTSRMLSLYWKLQSPKIRERWCLAQDNKEASCFTGSLSWSEHFSAMLCFIHLCMRFSEKSLFPGECIHALLVESRTNNWIWPTQAFNAEISIGFAEILSCSPGYGLPGRSGHHFVHCCWNQFQPADVHEGNCGFHVKRFSTGREIRRKRPSFISCW